MQDVNIDRICYGCVGILERPGIKCPHCGWDNTIREDQWGRLPAMTLKDGRFFVGRPLGAGGFGVTYLGRDMMAGEFEDARRAIKEFFPMGMAIRDRDGVGVLPQAAEMVSAFERRKNRSRREGSQMAEVSARVNNVVRAYDCFEENGTTYLVMEYIDGEPLSKIVKKSGCFSPQEAYNRLRPVLIALKKMHDMNIYHMDISPDNIMLKRQPDGSYGEPYVLDFGSSIEVGANDVTRSRSAMTVRDGYTPPEQYVSTESDLSGFEIQPACMDEYAICATLYYMITGKAPTSSTARQLGAKIEPLSAFDKSTPVYMDNAVVKGMAMRASERYADMDELIKALDNTVSIPTRWRKIVVIAAVLCLCGIAVAVLLRLPSRKITLDERGMFTWNRSDGVLTGTLVGRDGARTIRYTIEDGETIRLTAPMLNQYDWVLEELKSNGKTKETSIRVGSASEVMG